MDYIHFQKAAFSNDKLVCSMGQHQALNLEQHSEHNQKRNKRTVLLPYLFIAY